MSATKTESRAASKFEPQTMTAAQRGRKDRSGAGAAKVMRGGPVDAKEAEAARPKSRNYPGAGSHFKNPTEFLAGPSEPGKVRPSLRRFDNAEKDTVAIMLTDEFMMSGGIPPEGGKGSKGAKGANGAGAGGAAGNKSRSAGFSSGPAYSTRGDPADQRAVNLGPKDNLGNHCEVKTEEAPFHTGTRMTHMPEAMDAPYYEDQDPKPPRENQRRTGTRHFKERKSSLIPDSKLQAEEEKSRAAAAAAAKSGKTVTRSNRANESVNVINLGLYSAEDLHEPRENPNRQWGPRKWKAPDMPPAKPPAVKPIKTYAKDEHDVLGTGRFGKPEVEKPHGVAKGECRPPKDTANLFKGGDAGRGGGFGAAPAAKSRSVKQQPSAAPRKNPIAVNNMLRYYDPNVDKPADFAPARVNAKPSKSNMESNPAKEAPAHPTGKRHFKQGAQRDNVNLTYGGADE